MPSLQKNKPHHKSLSQNSLSRTPQNELTLPWPRGTLLLTTATFCYSLKPCHNQFQSKAWRHRHFSLWLNLEPWPRGFLYEQAISLWFHVSILGRPISSHRNMSLYTRHTKMPFIGPHEPCPMLGIEKHTSKYILKTPKPEFKVTGPFTSREKVNRSSKVFNLTIPI